MAMAFSSLTGSDGLRPGLEHGPAVLLRDAARPLARSHTPSSCCTVLALSQCWHGSHYKASLCLKADPWSRHAHCICDSLLLIWPEHIGDVCAIARACWQPGDLMGGCAAHAPYCRQAFQCTQMKHEQANSCTIWMWKREMLATRGIRRRSCTAAAAADQSQQGMTVPDFRKPHTLHCMPHQPYPRLV